MLAGVDRWLAKRLFVPVIIKWCQKTKMTQYAVFSYCWMAAIMSQIWFWKASKSWIGWFMWALVLLCGVFSVIRAGLSPDTPIPDRPIFRRVMLATVILLDLIPSVLLTAVTRNLSNLLDHVMAYNMLVLTAEYALTITRIPPEEKKRSTSLKPAYSRA